MLLILPYPPNCESEPLDESDSERPLLFTPNRLPLVLIAYYY